MITEKALSLAQQLDRLDPEKDWEARLALGEELKAALGERAPDFERCHDALLQPVRIEVPAADGYEVRLVLSAGPIREVVFSLPEQKVPARLVSLFHGSANLLRDQHKKGLGLPVRLPLAFTLLDGAETVLSFSAAAPCTVEVRFVRGSVAEAALRIVAALAVEAPAPDPAAPAAAPASPEEAAPFCPRAGLPDAMVREVVRLTLEQAAAETLQALRLPQKDRERATAEISRRAGGALLRFFSAARDLPEGREPAALAAALLQQTQAEASAEDARLAAALSVYRALRQLQTQAQVSVEPLRAALAAWEGEKGALLGTPLWPAVQREIAQIDAQLKAERAAPPRNPHQLPGSRKA